MPRRGRTTRPLPLEGILVADFSRVLAGPLCTQLLADQGARVIKVEEPAGGDETRRWGPPFLGGESTYFLSVNRNKESLAIDLTTVEGQTLARELITRADVVVDNFLPRQRRRLGLSEIHSINPGAIHCSISGFDPESVDAEAPGYDLLAQAGGGLMAITGEAAGEPSKIGVALSDVLTAHYAHGAICAALVGRERSGQGARLEISLFGATLGSLVNVAQAALATEVEARRYGNAHPSIVPYQLFHGSDRPFALGGGTDRHFRQLCAVVIGQPELAEDPRFTSNAGRVLHREELITRLEAVFRTREAAWWISRCREAAIPCSLVQRPLEALRSEPASALIAPVEHPVAGRYLTVLNPVRYDGQRLPIRTPPPRLGEHTERVTRELTAPRKKGRRGAPSRPAGKPPGPR